MSATTCPSCGAEIVADAKFCESCGKPVGDPAAAATTAAAPAPPSEDLGSGPISAPTHITPVNVETPAPGGRRPCVSCGGTVGPDTYCEQCGTKQPSERDHFRETPAPWVAGVCDRGIRHTRNEDAMALLASPTAGERAVLVVLDGVSNTDDSDQASLAGARAAREVLRTPLPRGMGTPESRLAAVTRVFADAVAAANDAVVGLTPEGSEHPPSATFVAAIVEGTVLSYANVGDSRAYWLPDGGPGVQLSVDDSAAQLQMEAGMSRLEAESGPQGHAITRWLGRDAPDLAPRVGEVTLDAAGWVLVCSDGLWNYASEPDALVAQITAAATSDPAALAVALTEFANAQGGQDNITVALARIAGQNAGAAAEPVDQTEQSRIDQGESDG
ncbi:MAG TPA: zinc ribbon domain-containing protein [Nocardioides sp.]|nr:zinc ribbon domain-containing protein [Nocardioides sp.]